ncbi:MAG TPA: DNA polymerase domain-containing protein [Kofleriaceae bacterium]
MRDDWLFGRDPTPGIVSVWAEPDGRAFVWRRVSGRLVRDDERFRPWLVLAHARDVAGDPRVAVRELAGEGELRFVARSDEFGALVQAVLRGASRRLGHAVTHVRDLGNDVLALAPDEQYLVATGRGYFKDLAFDELHRLQVDLETTGLDPQRDRIFLAAVRANDRVVLIEDGDEAALIGRIVAAIRDADPDVIENHNLHGFDLPFLVRRAERLGVPLELGRLGGGLRQRAARRGVNVGTAGRAIRFIAPGRELVDTLDLALRGEHGRGLKQIARSLGIAAADREYIRGDRVHATYLDDPARVRRYAAGDVEEVAHVAKLLGGAPFALATMVPRRYERLVDAGAATGVLDPLLVRAYLTAGAALPAHATPDGTSHSGASLHLFAAGVAHRVMKADVASLYPSLMRAHRIGPARDRLGALLALVDGLVERRLAAKAAARAAPHGSPERYAHEAVSAAMKLVVNSAYGYLAAPGLTRFADVQAANEVTRHGRATLELMCKELAARGIALLEADTDGVYGAVPEHWTEADERAVVAAVNALLPPLVQLEHDGRFAAMLSHEPKNYALLGYDGALHLRGVAFRSSRAEPFGEAFLRAAVARLLAGDVPGMRAAYLETIAELRGRRVKTYDVSSRVKLTKSAAEYGQSREARRELAYEALLAAGRTSWTVGDRVRVYRAIGGAAGLVEDDDQVDAPRDYDVEHYIRVLRDSFASRLQRAFEPDDFATLFDDPDQLSLFAKSPAAIRPILTAIAEITDSSRNGV